MSVPDNIQWKKLTSSLGKAYEVGTVPRDAANTNVEKASTDVHVASKTDFGTCVKWPVGPDTWINSPADLQNTTAIHRYKLHKSKSPLFDYVLEITNLEHYNYYFSDETGDRYQIDTYENGDHYVRYNSKKPTIIFISGS